MKDLSHILIASDIDGTFLDSHGKIVGRNIDAIERFKSEGGSFAFSTGRYETTLPEVVPNFDKIMNVPGIFCNGAYIYDADSREILDGVWMDGESTIGILREAERLFPNIAIRFTSPEGPAFIDGKPDASLDLGKWSKILFIDNKGDLEPVREYIMNKYPGRFSFSKSCSVLLEMLDIGATKGTMLDRLKIIMEKRLGHSVTAYAIGDYENDLDMLRHADVAACPSNALDTVKNICTVHVRSCSDGAVADLIEYIENNA
ncbi:MAG: HAD hydrolase family protein [Eubacteriales bacterium]